MSAARISHAMSREDYDRAPGVNFSTLKELARSPAHYRYRLLHQRADTDALKLGRAGHVAVLEPEKFRTDFAVWMEGRRAGKAWEAFKEQNSGRDILTEDEADRCLGIQTAVRSHRDAERYTSGGKPEVSMFWRHTFPAIGGLPEVSFDCKGRVDFIANCGALVDIKTARDVSPEEFSKSCWRYRYHMQAAYYSDGYEAATGQRLPFVVVAVEAEAPYVVQVYRLPDEILELGRAEYRDLLQRLALCRSESRWPGYADGELELTLPKWAAPKNDEDGAEDLGLVIGSAATPR